MGTSKARSRIGLIYVIAGAEASLVDAQCDNLLDELLEPEHRMTGLFRAEPREVSPVEILDELRTVPFLSDKRVVLVKNADKFVSENRELLEKYFDNPCSTGILILTVNSWPTNTRLAKKLPSVGRLLKVTEPKPWQLPQRLIQYARDAYSKNLSKEAAELLIELSGDELGRLYGEIDKLALFTEGEKKITTSHVESLVGHNRLYNAFAVINACLKGDAAGAVNRLRNMFTEDRSAEYMVVGAFAFHFRRMFNAKVLLDEGVGPKEIASRLRIWSNKDGFFEQLRRMSLRQLGENLQQLANIDYAIKTGRTSARVAIEQMVLRLTGGSDKAQTKTISKMDVT
ncbi:MAG: DNA polymerase III subunit delta [Planctomycetota bacterium]|jgi:DNA polymerase-3 subunit delta